MAPISPKHLCVFATLLFSAKAGSQQWAGPAQTVPFAHWGNSLGWTPRPTPAPELLRRQEGFHSLCGYVDGNTLEPVSCPSAYCGYNTLGGTPVAGCCTSTYASGGSEYLTGCNLATACYDYGACDASCSSANYYNYYETCLSSAYPYCGLLSYTQDGAVSFFCTDAPSLTFVAAYETEASVSSSQSAEATQSSSSDVVSSTSTSSMAISSSTSTSTSSMVISSSTSSITPSPVPFTQSQQTAGTTSQPSAATTTTISSASGMLVLSDRTRIVMILAMTMAMVLVIFQ